MPLPLGGGAPRSRRYTVSVRDVRLVERASLLCGTAVGPVLRVRRESAAEPDVT